MNLYQIKNTMHPRQRGGRAVSRTDFHPYNRPDSHPYYRPDFQHMNDLLGEYHKLVGRTYYPPREDRELLAVLQKIAADNEDRHRELISGIWLLFHSMTLTKRAVKQLHRTVAHWPVLAMADPRYHDVRTANWYPDFRDWFAQAAANGQLHAAQQREYLDAIGQPHLLSDIQS